MEAYDELGEWDAEKMRAYFERREGRRIEALQSGRQPADVIAGQVDGGEPAGGVEPQPDQEARPPATGAPELRG